MTHRSSIISEFSSGCFKCCYCSTFIVLRFLKITHFTTNVQNTSLL
uniref:Uncharacterized protein n=1 Tax=Lepeophtheirus salmonis TaxID=72036 RepID=A0A0K2US69_LEPSM